MREGGKKEGRQDRRIELTAPPSIGWDYKIVQTLYINLGKVEGGKEERDEGGTM